MATGNVRKGEEVRRGQEEVLITFLLLLLTKKESNGTQ